MTRLIDADALDYGMASTDRYSFEYVPKYQIDNAPTVDTIPVELVAEMFDNVEPCNFGLFGIPVDDFMFAECGDWCESNCDKVPAVECWKKFFEAWEERKDEWIR